MGLIRLQNVCKQFGGRVVLDDVSLELPTNQIIGLVGANGAGKTTLFRLIAGLLPPDSGTVTLSKGLQIGYLPQEPQIAEGQTLHDEVLSVFSEVLALERKLQVISEQMSAPPPGSSLEQIMAQYDRTSARFEAAGGYAYEQRLGEILGGLGFEPGEYQLPMAALSGGQKCRAALAKLLLQESQFLLLDEPTNHLDIDAVRWLEKFLAGHHGGAVIVSHDRYLLDRLAERILEIEGGHLRSFPGNYTNYVRTKQVRQLTEQRQYELDSAFIKKEQEYIARSVTKDRAAQAKGRHKRLQRRLAAGELLHEKPAAGQTVRISFDRALSQVTAGRNVLSVSGLCKRYGDKVLLADLSFEVPVGTRLGITGPNGVGKTTLLKIVLGQVPPDAGTFRLDPKARAGYYAQEPIELDADRTVVQEILTTRPDLLESQARSFAASFLFRGEEPFKRVGQLSGGEQSRVRLMKIILSGPNVLILDEPTNHLDIPSREALEAALLEFDGTIITVSHDRYFLDRICDRLLVLRLGRHALYNGNYSYYIEQVEQERLAAEAPAPAGLKRRPRARSSPGAVAADVSSAVSTGAKPPRSRLARLKLDELETLIMERETRLADLQQRFGEARIYLDPAALAQLRCDYDELKAELEQAQAEWERRADNQ